MVISDKIKESINRKDRTIMDVYAYKCLTSIEAKIDESQFHNHIWRLEHLSL